MEILNASRATELVYFDDPNDDPDTPCFEVPFDDESIEELLGKVGDAIDRAQSLDRKSRAAKTDEERAEVNQMMVRLQKRVISAFIGSEGYDALLEWMGRGTKIDPSKHIRQLGEVFASLLMLLGRKATSEQLRECGIYYARESKKTAEFLDAQRKGGRQQYRAVAGGKKKRSK